MAGAIAVVLAIAVGVGGYLYLRTAGPEPETKEASQKPQLPATLSTVTGEMVLASGGTFLHGMKNEPVDLPHFYIDKTEVSNEAYQRFAAAQRKQLPPDFPSDKPDLPVVNVTFDEARDFCQWAGKRLPTGDEWEKAARGTDGRLYAWGNEPDATRANVSASPGGGGGALQPVDSNPRGASEFGALNMTGNAVEWVNQPEKPSDQAIKAMSGILSPPPTANEPWFEVRGGSFDRPLAEAVAYEFISMPARFHAANIGFRCAANPPSDQ